MERAAAERQAAGVVALGVVMVHRVGGRTIAARASAGPFKPRPRKRFGQHFLAAEWAQKVVRAIDPQPGDIFLEIGPGTGALTLPLAAAGLPLLAVEIDRDLASSLAGRVPPNVTLMTADFMETDVVPFLTGLEPQRPATERPTHEGRRFRAVGNLPYNLSSPI